MKTQTPFPGHTSQSSSHRDREGVSKRSLFNRLSIGIPIFVISGVAYVSYCAARNLILGTLKQAALVEVQQGVDKVDQWLAVRKAEVNTLANSPSLKTMDWTIAIPYLEAEIERLDIFYHFALVYPDGEYYVTNVGKADANLSDRPHIQTGFSGEIVISNPVISRVHGFPVVIIVTPIWAGVAQTSNVIGLNTGVIDIKRLSDVVNGLKYRDGSYAFALNSEGVPIVHPDETRVGALEHPAPSFLQNQQADLRRIAQQMVSRNKQIDLAIIDGESVYVAQVPLRETNWSIALVIPQKNIEAQLQPLDLMVLTIVGLAGTLAIVLWRVQEFEKTQLKQSKAAADAANKAKGDFLATMSHELRTPLHTILGFGRILSENPDVQAGRKEIDIIRRSSDHLLELINDILTMSKIEAGHIALHNHNFDLFEILTTLQDMLELRADAKGLSLSFELAKGVPQYIYADERKLRQVLLNLLGNGIKFTDQGHITLRVSPCCQLFPSLKSSTSDTLVADCLSFQIEDTGPGIPAKEIPRLFQPFSQTQIGITAKEGTGLGLAISQRFVQLMGGRLQVSSRLNQGSVFSFEIACIPVNSQQIEKQYSTQPVLGLIDGQPSYRILAVDDRPTNRELIRRILEPVGFEIRDVDNGQKAVSMWQSWRPHLIWMDMRMPVMSGYEATQAIRAAETEQRVERQTPIIALTASAFDENREAILAAGCNDLVHKPFTPETLFRSLAEHLGVEYIYGESIKSMEPNVARNLSPDQLPKGWLKQLYQLAYEADGQGVQTLIEQLPAGQSAWAMTLSKWLDDFRFDAIIDLVAHLNLDDDKPSPSETHPRSRRLS